MYIYILVILVRYSVLVSKILKLRFRPKIELLRKIQGCHDVRQVENDQKPHKNHILAAAGLPVANEKAGPSLSPKTPSVLKCPRGRAFLAAARRPPPPRDRFAMAGTRSGSATEPVFRASPGLERLRISSEIGFFGGMYVLQQGADTGKSWRRIDDEKLGTL